MGLRLNCSRGFAFSRWAKKPAALQWTAFPAVEGQSRMNPAKFCNQFRQRRWFASTAKHVFAVIDGVGHDEAPPDRNRYIYGAWEVVGWFYI